MIIDFLFIGCLMWGVVLGFELYPLLFNKSKEQDV